MAKERKSANPSSQEKKKIGLYTHFRNLYQRVSLPDNFTDSDFFASLQVNPNPKVWNQIDVILKSSRATLQCCVSVVFFVIYYHLSSGTLNPTTVFPITILTTFIGYCFYQIYPSWPVKFGFTHFVRQFPVEHAKLSVIYLIFSYQLAP